MPLDLLCVHADTAIFGKGGNHQLATMGKTEEKIPATCRVKDGPAMVRAQKTPLIRKDGTTTYPGQSLPDQETPHQKTTTGKSRPEPLIMLLLPGGKIPRWVLGSRGFPLVKQRPGEGGFLSHNSHPLKQIRRQSDIGGALSEYPIPASRDNKGIKAATIEQGQSQALI